VVRAHISATPLMQRVGSHVTWSRALFVISCLISTVILKVPFFGLQAPSTLQVSLGISSRRFYSPTHTRLGYLPRPFAGHGDSAFIGLLGLGHLAAAQT
jgi:hypothetical protein